MIDFYTLLRLISSNPYSNQIKEGRKREIGKKNESNKSKK
jgi:hypothetical protein